MSVLSLDYERIYARGGWYGEDDIARASLAQGPLAQSVGTIYPSYEAIRPLPVAIASEHPATPGEIARHYSDLNAGFSTGPSCELFCIQNALLLDRTLYVPGGDRWVALYETHRSFERELKTVAAPSGSLDDAATPRGDRDFIYIGSVASENYGHWMIDDVARARAIAAFGRDRQVCVLLDRYHHIIDSIRLESLARVFGDLPNVTVEFIDKKSPYFFKALYYVTPHSYQAILKSPEALSFTRAALSHDRTQAPERIFVDRAALWRNLVDAQTVATRLERFGFARVFTDGMSLEVQAAIFSRARVVVGVVGAALVNTLFSPAGARVIYLAPEGFLDPFYWDLAARNAHEYFAIYGTPVHPHRPNFSSFSLAERLTDTLCAWAAS